MNNGGLIEGLQKCYNGKNLLKKHGFLYILSFIISLPSVYAVLKTGGNKNAANLFLAQHPELFILIFVASIVFLFYCIKFLHNAIKLFIWQDTQKDQERVKAMDIMPDVRLDIFKNWWNVLKFGIIWCLTIVLTIIILALLSKIPAFNFLAVPILFVVMTCMAFSIPYIIAGFAKNYDTKGNISPSLIFTLVPKVFIPATILGLKYFIFAICVAIVQSIIVGISTGILRILNLHNNLFFLTLVFAIFVYAEFISTFVFYYAVAGIYYRKIEIEREI